MMRVNATQTAAWEREDLERWFEKTFPERAVGKPREEVAAYLETRRALAEELGFTRPEHLRYLIGYEIGCGVAWTGEGDLGPSAPVVSALRRRDLAPGARIKAAERLLYGVADV
jgi:hypothetical protein